MALRSSHHDDRSGALAVGVVGALRRDVAAHGRRDRQHHAVGRRLHRVLGEQGVRCRVGFRQRVVLSFLVLDVVAPRTCPGQFVLLLRDFEIRLCDLECVAEIVERVPAHRFGIEVVGLLLLAELVLRVPERRIRGFDLRFGDLQRFRPGLRPELLQQGERGFGLGLLLFRGRPLHRIVQRDQRRALAHSLPFGHQDLRDDARHLGIDIDVRAAGLLAFDYALRVNAFRVRIRCRIEHRRLRGCPLAIDIGADQARRRLR